MFCLTSSDSLCVSDNLQSERCFDRGALERLTSAEKMQLCEATGGLWEVVASSLPLFQLWQTPQLKGWFGNMTKRSLGRSLQAYCLQILTARIQQEVVALLVLEYTSCR